MASLETVENGPKTLEGVIEGSPLLTIFNWNRKQDQERASDPAYSNKKKIGKEAERRLLLADLIRNGLLGNDGHMVIEDVHLGNYYGEDCNAQLWGMFKVRNEVNGNHTTGPTFPPEWLLTAGVAIPCPKHLALRGINRTLEHSGSWFTMKIEQSSGELVYKEEPAYSRELIMHHNSSHYPPQAPPALSNGGTSYYSLGIRPRVDSADILSAGAAAKYPEEMLYALYAMTWQTGIGSGGRTSKERQRAISKYLLKEPWVRTRISFTPLDPDKPGLFQPSGIYQPRELNKDSHMWELLLETYDNATSDVRQMTAMFGNKFTLQKSEHLLLNWMLTHLAIDSRDTSKLPYVPAASYSIGVDVLAIPRSVDWTIPFGNIMETPAIKIDDPKVNNSRGSGDCPTFKLRFNDEGRPELVPQNK